MAESARDSSVLLVEDNSALADNLAEILEGAGYAVRSAGRCSEAREAARLGFDVALVDVRLPDGDGIQLAPELKALVPEAEVILLTGFATLESAIGAVRAGAWAYLVKPCAPPDLLIALAQAMRQVRLHRETRALSHRAQIAEKLAALGTMAAGLAHEIRNPLNAGQLQLQIAERRLRTIEAAPIAEVLECLGLVRAEMDRLNRIVEEILDFARPAALQLTPGDLSSTVTAVARFLAPDAASVGVELHVVGTEAPLPARYDEGRIKQVLINLVRNGVEAAGKGGEVSIHLRRAGAAIELSVEDTGPGVPEGVDPLVPFFTTKARGTGLGLSTAHRIVTEHGGTLYPTRRDGRTAFIAQLPAAGS
jgi:signal transduction histidine kinase